MNASHPPHHAVGLPVCTVNEFGRLIYWNDNAAELFGRSAAEVVGREWHTVVHTIRSPQCCPLCQTRTALRNGELVYPVDVTLTIDGCHRRAVLVPLPIGTGALTSIDFIILTPEVIAATTSGWQSTPVESGVRQLNDGQMIDELTVREREILACVVNGLDARTIGSRLGISHATARTYVQRVLNKLGVRNKAQAVSVALTYNLVEAAS